MDSSARDQNKQFNNPTPEKVLSTAQVCTTPELHRMAQALQNGLVNGRASSIKPKHTTTSPSCPPIQTTRDRVDSASIHGIGGSIQTADDQLLNATGGRDNRMRSQQQEAPTEGADDLPPIAFLREPSVSPVFSMRRLASPVSCSADAGSKAGYASEQRTLLDKFGPSTSTAPSPVVLDGRRASSSVSRGTVTGSGVQRVRASATVPSSSPPVAASRSSAFPAPRFSSESRHGSVPHDARTRAKTGASLHEPAPRYRYTYNSLMRRPTAPEDPQHADPRAGTPVISGQRELEAAYETVPARVGVLRGRPVDQVDTYALAASVERLRDGMDVNTAGMQERWVLPCANTSPTAAYVALLEDTFGAGSALRGEGAKPMDALRPRKVLGKSLTNERSTSSSSSAAEMHMDVDTDVSVDAAGEDGGVPSRAQEWIAEIQTVVKGKRQLVREDIMSLLNTLREIGDMSAAEGRALGHDEPRLRKSIRELAQMKDIPFRDEFQVRGWARRLVKSWPAP
ncbi:hypothetical protein B0H12DRAFT_1139231 [Mycena haematopus]|nr:hypothetical protein B0H12DRAFT_1139231 [Mycena haematopus]